MKKISTSSLSHVFRNAYDGALADLPVITSSINITKLEVWVTNIGAAVTQNRNIVAFTDLGEYNRIQSYSDSTYSVDNLSG